MNDIELFAGGGGMAVGMHVVGFGPSRLYELDKFACRTLQANTQGRDATLDGLVIEGDVAAVDWRSVPQPVRVIAGGAPCQPFSLGGLHRAYEDGRNLFPQVLRAVRDLNPAAVVLENVRGLVRESFFPYFEYILAQLECPSIRPRRDELWQDHHKRIRLHRRAPGIVPEYRVTWRLVDAADYGVPQNRYRVVIVATRDDVPAFGFPLPTHSKHALIRAQESGAYWDERGLRRRRIVSANGARLSSEDGRMPWVTVRDALDGLSEPTARSEDSAFNHWRIPGARSYPGHQGSRLDWPSKAIKAGVHGVPGGENTLVDDRGNVRYYTLREAARIQSFPDNHVFCGARIHVTRQIGNAVPVTLTAALAAPLHRLLEQSLAPAHHVTVSEESL